MKINIKETNAQSIVIALQGELDTLATEQFSSQLEPIMAAEGKNIEVNFSELEYISSAGMRILILLNKTAVAKGGKVIITGMSEDIRQLFQMTGIDQMIEIRA